jgi:hypothetical protein
MTENFSRFLATLSALLRGARARTPEGFEIVGLSAIAFGVGMIYLPAGIIAAGIALCFLGYATGGDK